VPFNVTPQRHLYLGNTKYTAALKEVWAYQTTMVPIKGPDEKNLVYLECILHYRNLQAIL
jgi:hypothetical protein